jgi:hypothetical protein
MAGRGSSADTRRSHHAKVGRRRVLVTGGGALGAFVAAAAMATSSAAPAKADFDDLLDPIIQPILTQVTDSLASIDPTLATDLTSWTDTFLADLNSLDSATAASSTALAAAASPDLSSTSGTYDLPIVVQEDTEPTVSATVNGTDTSLLVDTGSSGLVIPSTDLGSNFFTQLLGLFELGLPTGISSSGFSSGVDYTYLTYDVPVDYATTTGTDLDTTTPVEVEIYSFNPDNLLSFFTNDAFQEFDKANDVTGVLGIGDDTSGSAGESPIEAAGFTGVTVDLPQDLLIVSDSNPGTPYAADLPASGSTISGLTETVTTSTGQPVGSATVSDDIDSGGVYGTIPSSIDPSTLAQNDVVTVKDGDTVLYSYVVGTDTDGTDEAPEVTSGTSIDSGIEAFKYNDPVYIDYSNDTISFDDPLS